MNNLQEAPANYRQKQALNLPKWPLRHNPEQGQRPADQAIIFRINDGRYGLTA